MLAGLEEISGGEIRIGDTVINDKAPKDRDIAMVFQNYALYPHMSVYENMAFGLKIRKFPRKEIDLRVQEAAEILELKKELDRKPGQLSGGQKQRVAMGRAIVRKPKVFLFDEPLSNLDAKLRVQMRSEISKLHTRLQTTMIYVTHDQVEAMTMGDAIVVMSNGLIQQADAPLKIYNHPRNKYVAGFIGTPPMNFFDLKISREGSNVYLVDTNVKIKLTPEMASKLAATNSEDEITFGVRPEDIYLKSSYTGKIDENVVKGEIEVVEPLGAITYLYVNTGSGLFIARGEATIDHQVVGQSIELAFDMNKTKIFKRRNVLEEAEVIVDL
jgi:multiple sugar transport system ATP-binding protein